MNTPNPPCPPPLLRLSRPNHSKEDPPTLWLNPSHVTLGPATLSNVRQVAVEQKADRLVVAFGDAGPHAAFVDAPERRVVVKLRRRVLDAEDLDLAVGDRVPFAMRAAPTAGDGPGVTVNASVVLSAITYRVERHDGAEQVIEAVAVSTDGATAPVTVSTDGGAS